MSPVPTPLLAAVDALQGGRPLFGHLGLAILAVLGGIAVLLAFTALLGRWLAATHPAPAPRPLVVLQVPTPAHTRAPELGDGVAPEVVPIVLAAVAQVLGVRARVAAIRRSSASPSAALPSVEALMQQWSYEGRRQIYSSHKVR